MLALLSCLLVMRCAAVQTPSTNEKMLMRRIVAPKSKAMFHSDDSVDFLETSATLDSSIVATSMHARARVRTDDLSVYRKRLLQSGATYDQSMVAPLATLPVLTESNIDDEADWHTYVHRIYGGSVTYPIHLNDFTWFYWFAPIRLDNILLSDCDPLVTKAPYGTPWIGGLKAWTWGPEHLMRAAGFFVHRQPWESSKYQSAERLEVMRQGPTGFTDSYELGKHKPAYYFHAIGSGIYVPKAPFNHLKVRIWENAVDVVELQLYFKEESWKDDLKGAAKFWQPSVRYELRDGTTCKSTAAANHILSCSNLPVPLWRPSEDPEPRPVVASKRASMRRERDLTETA